MAHRPAWLTPRGPMPSAGGAADPVTEATKPCPLHSCRRRTCLITDKVPAVTSRPILLPGATMRSWPVALIAELGGRWILRLTASPHLDHRPSPDARIFRLRPELSAWKQPAAGHILRRLGGEAIVAAFRVGPSRAQRRRSAERIPGRLHAGDLAYWHCPGGASPR